MSWFERWFGNRAGTSEKKRRRPPAVRPRLESLEERQVPTVSYYGGHVLPHVEAQAFFLGSDWASVPPHTGQTSTVNNFLADITTGAYMDALTRAGYGVGRGSASAGAVDTVALATNSTISDASIERRIQADISSGLLQAPDPNRLYIVYVEPNVAVNLGGGQGTTQQGILGYHGAFAGRDASGNSAVIRYAVVAYPGGSVHNSSMGTSAVDQLTAVTSHELAEAVTDPDVDFGRLGWYDPRRGEIGDVSENNPNALVRLDGYLVQEVVGTNDQLLAIAASPPPVLVPPTPPAPRIATTTTLTAGPVHYPWWSPFPTVSLTVTVAAGSPSAIPGGTVELLYHGAVLGTAQVHVVNGVATATFNVRFFGPGSFTFSTQYLGSTQFDASTSNSLTVRV